MRAQDLHLSLVNFNTICTFNMILVLLRRFVLLKLRYCEKATKLEKISHIFSCLLSNVKTRRRFFKFLRTFSENLTFSEICTFSTSWQVNFIIMFVLWEDRKRFRISSLFVQKSRPLFRFVLLNLLDFLEYGRTWYFAFEIYWSLWYEFSLTVINLR